MPLTAKEILDAAVEYASEAALKEIAEIAGKSPSEQSSAIRRAIAQGGDTGRLLTRVMARGQVSGMARDNKAVRPVNTK